jgi:hypothetical protein
VEVQSRAGAGRSACAGGGRLWAGGMRRPSDSQTRASPSDHNFQPVPVHGKKLNQ